MIAIIPDVHGRQFWKDVIPRKDEFEKIIFLGDYLDPYGFEEISNLNALDNFKEILEFKKSPKIGNIIPDASCCSSCDWSQRKFRKSCSSYSKS